MKKAFILKKIQCSKHTAHFLGDSNALLHEISDIHTQPNEKILKQLFFKKKTILWAALYLSFSYSRQGIAISI